MSGQGTNENPIYNWGLAQHLDPSRGKLLDRVFDTRKAARDYRHQHLYGNEGIWRVVRICITLVK